MNQKQQQYYNSAAFESRQSRPQKIQKQSIQSQSEQRDIRQESLGEQIQINEQIQSIESSVSNLSLDDEVVKEDIQEERVSRKSSTGSSKKKVKGKNKKESKEKKKNYNSRNNANLSNLNAIRSTQGFSMNSNRNNVPSSEDGMDKPGYTEQEINALRGKGNEERPEYDLGQDGAFSDFTVIVGCFYSEVKSCWDRNGGAALKKKGFKVTITDNERTFMTEVEKKKHDVAWIVSNQSTALDPEEKIRFTNAVVDFHRSGRGLFIFGDNDPYHVQANLVLPTLVNTTISGCTPAQRVLGYGNGSTAGEFDAEHLIFAGINYLYEGHTICYPVSDGKLKHLATSSDGHPCISLLESTPNEHGRVLIDNGFTKLYLQWDSAGQARYVVNATVYLVDVENRF